jgi:broad specificity phosphatase PhoE
MVTKEKNIMIYIMRHGQTDRNKEEVLQGRSNTELNQTGREEARRTGEHFRTSGITFSRCYSSPLKRAIETAELTAGLNKEQIITDDLLLEMDYGPYEGTSLKNPPREIITFFSDFVHNPAPKGMESLSAVTERLGRFLEHLDYDPSENILISTHAIAMKGALEYLTPDSHGSYWSKYIGNCAVYAFDKIDGNFTIPTEITTLPSLHP